jgi:ketosteroid isomerase-like protein
MSEEHDMQQGTSSRPNVDVVRRVYDAFKRRDLAEALSLFAPDVELTQSSEVPWGGEYKGHDGVIQFFGKLTQSINSTLALERFIDAGEHVVAIGRTQGTVNAGGNRYDVPFAHVWTIQNGLAVRIQFCIDNPTMLSALP